MTLDDGTGTAVGPLQSKLRRFTRSPAAWLVIDETMWILAVVAATLIRWLYVTVPIAWSGAATATGLAVVLHAVAGHVTGLYARGRVRGSYDEVLRLVGTGVAAGCLLLLLVLGPVGGRFVPGTIPILACGLAVAGMLTLRLVLRSVQSRNRALLGSTTPVVIVGAGQAAQALVRDLLHSPDAPYRPVALRDDAGECMAKTVTGLPVVRVGESLSGMAGRLDVRNVILALPDADSATIRRLADEANEAGLVTLVLPPATELPGQPVTARDVRPLRLEDLLGRRSVTVDEESVADQMGGRVVLVTGAGGVVGAALCLQVARAGAKTLVLLDRDESAMSAVLLELRGRGLDIGTATVLADIRDADAVRTAFLEHRPQVVLHAAGLQNVGMLERHPAEAWKTNVIGTLNVLNASSAAGALVVVNVSSDSADKPTTVLGYTRAIAERVVAAHDERCVGRYMSVRVGNLVEALGGVVRVFELQIRHGGPLTVSHPATKQRFMLADEAAGLILQCAALCDGGEVMLLDSGQPVRLADVARHMCRLAGRPELEIVYAGETRPEDPRPVPAERVPSPSPSATWHPLVSSVRPALLDDAAILEADQRGDVSLPLMRFLVAGAASAALDTRTSTTPEALDWQQIEREWAQDEAERTPRDAFTTALLDMQRKVAVQQIRDVQEIVTAAPAAEGQPAAPKAADLETTDFDNTPLKPIYLSKADVGPLEEKWVLKALRSGYVAPLGPMVDEFERRVAEKVGVKYALALSSGTAALHLLLLHVGARSGTYVVLPTMTFAATANAIMYTGSTPFFVDVQESDANIDVELMVRAVDSLRAHGEEVSAVVAVDLYGRCCDYSRIEPLLAERGVPLVEDAAEALGASHRGKAAGSFGIGAALSFNGNKIMTTSGGGMLLSDDGNLVERARYLSTQARQPVPWYEHTNVGFNYRMSNVLAGLGIAQLARLDDFIAHRREVRNQYSGLAARLPGGRILGREQEMSDAEDNCWLTTIIWNVDAWGEGVDELAARLGKVRIEARHLWKPLHGMGAYEGSGSLLSGAAESLFRSGLNLPSGVDLSRTDVQRTIRMFCARRANA